MLYNGRTVLAYGSVFSNGKYGHMWVIDGWKSIRHNYIRITYDGFGVEKSRELTDSETIDYVHCNMGYDGECDGYYTMTLFDCTYIKSGDEMETGYGDKPYEPEDEEENEEEEEEEEEEEILPIFAYNLGCMTYNF